MKIELKKININLKFSRETTMFTAELWVDGKCVGEAENRGNGGSTNYIVDRNNDDWDYVQKAEDYCQDMNTCLEDYIDDLLQKHLDTKEDKRFQNKLRKDLEKYICYSKDNSVDSCESYVPITFKPHVSLDKIFNTPNYKAAVTKKIDELKTAGFYILNKNLPIQTL